MSLPLPNLDDRTYAELVEEARSLISKSYPQWTDYNPTDPGIMLLEMLAWLSEMLLYRVDRIPDKNIEAFLKLLNGPEWQLGEDLETAIRKTIVELRQQYRAVSCEDFERLLLVDWPQTEAALTLGNQGVVKRVLCLKERNLEAESEPTRAPGHVSIVVVSDIASLEFAGDNDYIEIPPESIPVGQQITVSFWAYGEISVLQKQARVITANSENIRVVRAYCPEDNMLIYFDCGNDGNDYDRIGLLAEEDDIQGRWSHWAFTKNAETGEMKIYIDGNLWHSDSERIRPLPVTSSARIGSPYYGKIAEVRIWNYAHSAEEIENDMHRQLTGLEEGLVSYWPLNEGSGNVAYDRTPNQNHGSIHGAQWNTVIPHHQTPWNAGILHRALWTFLDERRLLTTRHHVVGPDYVTVKISATLYLKAGTLPDEVRQEAVARVVQFYDPLVGGNYGLGWPFGRDVYIGELYALLDNVPGVDYVKDVTLNDADSSVPLQEHHLVAIVVDHNSFRIE